MISSVFSVHTTYNMAHIKLINTLHHVNILQHIVSCMKKQE